MKFKKALSHLLFVLILTLTALLLILAAAFCWIAVSGNEETGTVSAFGCYLYLNDDNGTAAAIKNHSFIVAKKVEPSAVTAHSLIIYTVREPDGRLNTQIRRVLDVSPDAEGNLAFTLQEGGGNAPRVVKQDEMVCISQSVFSSSLLGRCLLFFYRNRTACLFVFYLVLALLLGGCILLLALRGRKRHAAAGDILPDESPSLDQLISVEQNVVFEKSSQPSEKRSILNR